MIPLKFMSAWNIASFAKRFDAVICRGEVVLSCMAILLACFVVMRLEDSQDTYICTYCTQISTSSQWLVRVNGTPEVCITFNS
jgi:hypothetical protein